MARAHVEIIGTGRLEARFAQIKEQLRAAAQETVHAAGREMTADVARHVRHDTGNLAESVKDEYENDGLTVTVGWRDRDDLYAQYQERGTRRMTARPTLVPALARASTQAVNRLRAETESQLRS